MPTIVSDLPRARWPRALVIVFLGGRLGARFAAVWALRRRHSARAVFLAHGQRGGDAAGAVLGFAPIFKSAFGSWQHRLLPDREGGSHANL